MPLYEYRCPKCKHLFDLFRAIEKRDARATCPECGHAGAPRALSRIQASVRGEGPACGGGGGFG